MAPCPLHLEVDHLCGNLYTARMRNGVEPISVAEYQHGFAAATDVEYAQAVESADIAVLYVPGISTLTAGGSCAGDWSRSTGENLVVEKWPSRGEAARRLQVARSAMNTNSRPGRSGASRTSSTR